MPKPWDEEYRRCWVQNVSVHSPPDTEIVLFGVAPNGESAIHDRWILSGEKGLRLGTSINSLGMKLSEISILNSEEAIVRLQEVEATPEGGYASILDDEWNTRSSTFSATRIFSAILRGW